MSDFQLSPALDEEKIFTVNRSELEKRFDPFYYVPSLASLEKEVIKHKPKPLRHYVQSIASGATPRTSESEKYYAEPNDSDAIPFLRVQNLSPTGFLQLDDVKYINRETHETMLKRSQVAENDLLVKITGVGRMAVSSVAPKDFIGNTNQHMVVIKTGSEDISTIIAAWLNTDIGEKLASRRSTGGTRPALDYPALLSIPVIFDERILQIKREAIEIKQKKEQEAQALLDGNNDFLLSELKVTLPEKDNFLESRIFDVMFSDISGCRFDCNYHTDYYRNCYAAIESGEYEVVSLRQISTNVLNGKEFREYSDFGFRYLRVTDLGKQGINNKNIRRVNLEKIPSSIRLTKNDLLISRSGSLGLVSIVTDELLSCVLSSHIFRVSLIPEMVDPTFLEAVLRTEVGQFQFSQKNNGGVIPEINQSSLKQIKIPLPPLPLQRQISKEILDKRNQADQLRKGAKEELEKAKHKIERLVFGG